MVPIKQRNLGLEEEGVEKAWYYKAFVGLAHRIAALTEG